MKMCFAIPGKIIAIKGDSAIVDYFGEKRNVKIISGDYKVGDYVFVSAKIIVQKIPEKEAIESLKIIKNGA